MGASLATQTAANNMHFSDSFTTMPPSPAPTRNNKRNAPYEMKPVQYELPKVSGIIKNKLLIPV
jgi:hypothetical protein